MYKLNYLKVALLLLCLHVSSNSFSQTVGSYDTTITFMSAARQVSLFVPPSYTPSTAYRLIIGLHGLGDNCVSYRSGLAGGLGWGAALPNTIIVCPEAANINQDYFFPAGDEAIIQASIDLAMSLYHIDTADVVLQGFSLGGRAALRYGLDNYTKFKGLLLNTPAVQGVKEATNTGTIYHFSYINAPHIPIYITHGIDDPLYESPIDSAYEQLILNDGMVRYYDIPGLAHAIPPIASIMNFISFFDTPSVKGYDLDVVSASVAPRSLTTSIPATCLVHNTGDQAIHSFTLHSTIASVTTTYTWTGSLAPFQHAVVSLPSLSAPVGYQSLDVKVDALDPGITDTITGNNEKIVPFQVATTGITLPLFEGFEAAFPPTNWVQYLAGDVYSAWEQDTDNKKTGTASMSAFNTILIFDNRGRKEELASPLLDLTTADYPHLTFDVAYNYHHYAPPFITADTVFADTLEVLISTDGGNTYSSLYHKGGAELATFPGPIYNPSSVASDFITPGTTHWRTEDIDLGAYASSNKAIVKFSYGSDLGGSINIDNINFAGAPVRVPLVAVAAYSVYPNPANDQLYVSTGNDHLEKIVIIDMAGKIALQQTNEANQNITTVNTSSLSEGMYVIQLYTDKNVQRTKLVIKR